MLVATTAVDLLQGEGALLALDTAGSLRWRLAGDWQQVGAPVVDGARAVCVANATSLLLIDWQDGALLAAVPLPQTAVHVAPALDEHGFYLACRGPHLLALARDGRLRWQFDHAGDAWLNETPAVAGGRVYAVTSEGHLLALDALSGARLWQTAVGPQRRALTPPATDGARVYVGSRSGVYALDAATGAVVWHCPTPKPVSAQPAVGGGELVAGGTDHVLRILDAATGAPLRTHTLPHGIQVAATAAAIGAQGLTIAVDRKGEVAALERPLSADELRAQDEWETAVALYVQQGNLRAAADLLEEHGQPARAAALCAQLGDVARAADLYAQAEAWEEAGALRERAGDREAAAQAYELGGAWERAAVLWAALDQLWLRAAALEGAARALADDDVPLTVQAQAWSVAADAYAEIGAVEQATSCRREMARQLQLPFITVDVAADGLAQGGWSQIRFLMRNAGYAEARFVTVRRARESHFEGDLTRTRYFQSLAPGGEATAVLDVKPLAFGERVPLTITVEYSDARRIPQSMVATLHLRVAPAAAAGSDNRLTNVFNAAVVDGPVAPEDVGRAGRSPQALRIELMRRFDMTGLKDLCFELTIDYEQLDHGRKQDLARDLLLLVQRENRYDELLALLARLRPDVNW